LGELTGDDPVEGDFLFLQGELAQRTEEEHAGFGTAAKSASGLRPENYSSVTHAGHGMTSPRTR
jgi:hypothetical protein